MELNKIINLAVVVAFVAVVHTLVVRTAAELTTDAHVNTAVSVAILVAALVAAREHDRRN